MIECLSSFTLQAVSNPKIVGTYLHFKSPSMVLGHPITRVFKFLLLHGSILKPWTIRNIVHIHNWNVLFACKYYYHPLNYVISILIKGNGSWNVNKNPTRKHYFIQKHPRKHYNLYQLRHTWSSQQGGMHWCLSHHHQ